MDSLSGGFKIDQADGVETYKWKRVRKDLRSKIGKLMTCKYETDKLDFESGRARTRK